MLTSIKLKNTASYKGEQTLEPLKELNFIYGENGCGKSTIAKFLNCKMNCAESSERFSDCSFETGWKENEQRKLFVYDADFVRRTISQSSLEGVFVMGEDAPELEAELKRHEAEIARKKELIQKHDNTLERLKSDIEKAKTELAEQCWQVGKKHSDTFDPAYTGFKKSRAKFRDKCIESHKKGMPAKSLEEIEQSASLYFNPEGKPEKLILPPQFAWADLTGLEPSHLLGESIKGKEETTVAELIEKLGNNDWVDQGRAFFDGKKCPFCQQDAPVDFKMNLEHYFDATYQDKKDSLAEYIAKYNTQAEQLVERINEYKTYSSKCLRYENVKNYLDALEAVLKKNKLELSRKQKELSERVEIDSIDDLLKKIEGVISESRQSVIDYNKKIEEFDRGKIELTNDIWTFLGDEISPQYQAYKKSIDGSNSGIDNINKQRATLHGELREHRAKVAEIGASLKNAAKPVDDINKVLCSFGFTNFSLKKEDDQAHYSIIREDGQKANETLSEGEKTFIAFLYFYQKVKGISESQSTVEDKIVIFDDPVSSLDSKVLYVVSTLIKSLAKERKEYKIHQLFILTHNVYFFKEVTNQQDAETARSLFWIIRKIGGCSQLERHEKNPVRTSYQMLWEEVIQAKDNPTMDVRNTLRRIIENYFELFGNIKKWKLAEKFDGDDKVICHSLLQWTNDGSHCVFDDLFVTPSVEVRDNYLRVFREIFIKNEHGEHYRMMMHEDKQ
ncbi:wobble nucleotide-excising tRNase [Desulfobaculum xiamenense]|uniref:Wobble nucleotide-excising tRNase n=1 Tax=Desulfobaculum xiamenense TaxID=995050 RepID=A0A846QPQ8_9BACT|nr:wobble nucleotide-excising tRNase [Desulfobaculum xiamenense]